ncbi:MAG: undecaprenyl-diphosphate phosphatase [Treponema sp.]|jgi:undecaprenyl-diphosphatase|nr:undecaprenyl-diphosphate phosphatase [Treponema sp.]
MSVFYAVILGIVQGVTEFLSFSSSGHLVLLQKVFGIEMPGLFFDTMLHAGTLIAVFAVLWKDILDFLRKIIQPLTGFLILATIPAVIAALIFGKKIESAFDTGQFLGVSFLATTVILVTAEFLSRRKNINAKQADKMSWKDALVIGFMQAIAIIPGISRSGATISGALSRKLDRDFAARFSFLLSIPAILGAVVLQTKNLIQTSDSTETIGAFAIIAGTLSAAIVGFFAIKLMLKIVREKSLYGFAIYTGVLGVVILIDQLFTRVVF